MKVPPVLLLRQMDATADHLGPVALWADCVVPLAMFVGVCEVSDMLLLFLLDLGCLGSVSYTHLTLPTKA